MPTIHVSGKITTLRRSIVMGAYRLDAILTDHQSWDASTHKGLVWVGAQTPHQARELAAAVTLVVIKPLHPYAPRPISPWLLTDVTNCVWYPDKSDVPEGAVATADGKCLGA